MPGLWAWGSSKLWFFDFFCPPFHKTLRLLGYVSFNPWDRQTHKLVHAASLPLSRCILPRVSWMLKVCRNDHYYPVSSACNTMATEGKCDQKMCSSSWQNQKHSPSRTWSKQAHLPNGVELIGVPCSGFITHFNALPHFSSSFGNSMSFYNP